MNQLKLEVRQPKPEPQPASRCAVSDDDPAPLRGRRAVSRGAVALALGVVGLTALAQYTIESWTIAGGGGTSTNAPYALSGTLGQADAGPVMTGGEFSLSGGFWTLPNLIQAPDAPVLSAAAGEPGFVIITWTPPATGWVLQESPHVEPPDWTSVPGGTNSPVTVPAALPARFYRLSRP